MEQQRMDRLKLMYAEQRNKRIAELDAQIVELERLKAEVRAEADRMIVACATVIMDYSALPADEPEPPAAPVGKRRAWKSKTKGLPEGVDLQDAIEEAAVTCPADEFTALHIKTDVERTYPGSDVHYASIQPTLGKLADKGLIRAVRVGTSATGPSVYTNKVAPPALALVG